MTTPPAQSGDSPRLFDESALRRTLARLAHEVVERHRGLDGVVLIGIRTRGVPLALRLADAITALCGQRLPVLAVDTSDFRDDSPRSSSGGNHALSTLDGAALPEIDGASAILVDDVLCTGRTLRAALDAVLTAGRPATVEMLVLVDRGHRELPLRATYVGKNVPTSSTDRVAVRLLEVDGIEGAWLVQGAPA